MEEYYYEKSEMSVYLPLHAWLFITWWSALGMLLTTPPVVCNM